MLEETIQMDMFRNTPLDWIHDEIKVIRQRTDNCRKGLFARHNELARMYYKMQEENQDLKMSLQQLKQDVQDLKDSNYKESFLICTA